MKQDSDRSPGMARHPIRVVSERTGLSPDLLRAWESRHSVVQPLRTEGGHRLYSDADIERLILLHRVTSAGRAIGQVAELSTTALAEMAREDDEARAYASGVGPAREPADAADAFTAEAIEAVRRLDPDGLDRTLRRAALSLGTVPFLQRVAGPFLHQVGSLWHEGTLRPAHEHLGSIGMRRVLEWLIGSTSRGNGRPRIVIGTPSGEHHEMGALLAAAAAESAGWQAIYLGPNLPADELAQASVWTGARVVALSAVFSPEKGALEAEIRDVRERLPPSVTLMLGGRGSRGIEEVMKGGRVVPITSIPDFIRMLEGLTSRDAP